MQIKSKSSKQKNIPNGLLNRFIAYMSTNKPALLLLLLALIFIAIGIWREETATVLIKSINICLECIGIG